MSGISIHLLGTFRIDGEMSLPTPLQSGKAQELFCYLLLHRDRPLLRETLADTLWGNSTGSHARKYLRQSLWQLQSGLDSLETSSGPPLVHVDAHWVRLDSSNGLWLDVSVLEHALATAHGIEGRNLTTAHVALLRSAISLYRGNLMEGWYQDWCLARRQAVQSTYLDILDKLIAYHESTGQWEEGIAVAKRILHIDRAHERTYQQLMRLYYQSGDRTRALRQYERCAAFLQEDLDIRPGAVTTRLFEQMRNEQWDDASYTSSYPEPASEPDVLETVATQLRQVQSRLAAMEAQVRVQLEAVESAIAVPDALDPQV